MSLLVGIGLLISTGGAAYAQQDVMDQPIWPADEVTLATPDLEQAAQEPFTVNGSILWVVYTATADEARQAFLTGDTGAVRAATDPAAKPYGLFLQTDTTGEPAYLVLDLSWLGEIADYPNLEVFSTSPPIQSANPETYESVELLIQQQPNGTFLAIQYQALAKGSMVNNTDWGVQEAYTTHDDTINARAGCNGPDDDEARNQDGGELGCGEDDDDED